MNQTEPAPEPICRLLEWDSNFFGRRIARLNRARLDEASVARALDWCNKETIDCLYFLADADDPETARLSEKSGFLQVDVRLTLERALGRGADISFEDDVRPAREKDLPALRAIAARAHHDSRFYFDHHFDRAVCDRLYETWIENSFRGFAQTVLVIESDGQPAGYVTGHLGGSESQLGLLGVAEAHHSQGLGTKLVRAFLTWSRQNAAARATVVTQGRNVAAQRLYQRNGFVTAAFQLWYHRWFSEAP